MDINARITAIEERIRELEAEKVGLLRERASCRDMPPLSIDEALYGTPACSSPPQSVEEKISLFLRLFRCRQDVYPRFWENHSKGLKGFSPVCKNEWKPGYCNKPKVKCSECACRDFNPFDERIAKDHLEGKICIGSYAIREDDTCIFLAADFDKASWRDDCIAYKKAAHEIGVTVAIEISKSGNGAHAWIFFSEPLPAYTARKIGTIIMAIASQNSYMVSLESYDRFFPNQDTIPKGGFGNLIALPLQKRARDKGTTIFVDDSLSPVADQWKFLSECMCISSRDISQILNRFGNHVSIAKSDMNDDADVAEAENDINIVGRHNPLEPFNGAIAATIGAKISIDIEFLPPKIIHALKRFAIFANPKFFELQRMRFSTWNTPRYICCATITDNRLLLPRGIMDQCRQLGKSIGAQLNEVDKRKRFDAIAISFNGTLTSEQEKAVSEMLKNDIGVLVAPPGLGKTVMSCAIIAQRAVKTLILVHRKQLLEQWESQLNKFLSITENETGIIKVKRKQDSGVIDVAMIQTIAKKEHGLDYCMNYEQIIIDECHHIPAVSFESVLSEIPAVYFLGLTATPYRKDGLQAIIHMQCGPTRYSMVNDGEHGIAKCVIIKETQFSMPAESGPQPAIHEVWDRLIADPARLSLIAGDVTASLLSDRFPLILSERKEHLALLAEEIKRQTDGLPVKQFILTGEMGKRARNKILAEIAEFTYGPIRPYILSTGSLIGEGFDLPALDTLIIAMPFSFKGKMIQYAGRLHRQHHGKSDVIIYDYVDVNSGLTMSMFKKRLSAYKEMGYQIDARNSQKILKIITKK